MNNKQLKWLKWVSDIQALAQSGLAYPTSDYDKERYIKLSQLAAELAAECSGQDPIDVANLFLLEKGYATPKIDVRAFVLKDDHCLLVKERADGLWTLPGGWADVNESPSEAVIRETKEESGYDVTVRKLLALWDKQKHLDHPPEWPHVYKCFFHCDIVGGEPAENLEIAEIRFFNINQLPPLSTPRVTTRQIARLYALVGDDKPTAFD